MIKLTKDLIHSCETKNGGFTFAQIEFLGFNPKDKWLNKAIGMMLTDEQFDMFKHLGTITSKEKKKLQANGEFPSVNKLHNTKIVISLGVTDGEKEKLVKLAKSLNTTEDGLIRLALVKFGAL